MPKSHLVVPIQSRRRRTLEMARVPAVPSSLRMGTDPLFGRTSEEQGSTFWRGSGSVVANGPSKPRSWAIVAEKAGTANPPVSEACRGVPT